jgi:hypothetical protein
VSNKQKYFPEEDLFADVQKYAGSTFKKMNPRFGTAPAVACWEDVISVIYL